MVEQEYLMQFRVIRLRTSTRHQENILKDLLLSCEKKQTTEECIEKLGLTFFLLFANEKVMLPWSSQGEETARIDEDVTLEIVNLKIISKKGWFKADNICKQRKKLGKMLLPMVEGYGERKQNSGEIHKMRKELLVLLYYNCQNCNSSVLPFSTGCIFKEDEVHFTFVCKDLTL